MGREPGARATHLKAFGLDRDGEADRSRGLVRDVDMDAEAPLSRLKMRGTQLNAGPFHEADHEAGGEYLGHGGELRRLFAEVGHRLGDRHRVGEKTVREPWLERRLHGLAPLSSRSGASPAFSSPGMAVSMPSHGLRKSKLRYSCISFTGS